MADDFLFYGDNLDVGTRIDMPAGGAHMTQVALPPTPDPIVHPDQLSLGPSAALSAERAT